MHQLLKCLFIILVALFVILWLTTQQTQSSDQDNQLAAVSSRLDALEAQTDSIQSMIDNRDEQIETALQDILGQLDEMRFEPWDIILEPELQAHTYQRSRQTGIPVDLLFAIMWRESGYQPGLTGYNANGTRDVGVCMINEVNWDWLAELGIDVHDPCGNIDAMVYILWLYGQKGYTEEQMLAAYNAGEMGMLRGGGRWYAQAVQEAKIC